MTKQGRVVKTVKRKTQIVKRTRNSYSVERKKEVIAYAKSHGNNQAARHFDIDCGMVSRWVSASSKWTSETKAKSKRVSSGRKALFPAAEKKLYTWIIQQRKQGLAVAYITIRNKILEILKEPEMVVLYGNLVEDFKTLVRLMSRINLFRQFYQFFRSVVYFRNLCKTGIAYFRYIFDHVVFDKSPSQ